MQHEAHDAGVAALADMPYTISWDIAYPQGCLVRDELRIQSIQLALRLLLLCTGMGFHAGPRQAAQHAADSALRKAHCKQTAGTVDRLGCSRQGVQEPGPTHLCIWDSNCRMSSCSRL